VLEKNRIYDRNFGINNAVRVEAESRKIGVLSVPNVLLLEAYESGKIPACPSV